EPVGRVGGGVDAELVGVDVAGALAAQLEIDVGVASFRGDLRGVGGGGVGDADLVDGTSGLVQHHLLVASVVGEPRAVVEADAVPIRIEAAAELRGRVVHDGGEPSAAAGEQSPGGAIVGIERVLVCDPGQPAFVRGIEGPGAILVGGNLASLAGPGAGRAGG